MTARVGTFRLRRYNSYVPAAQYANDVIHDNINPVLFGAPAVSSATGLLSAQSIATATNTIAAAVTITNPVADVPFGRNLIFVASGAATSTVTVSGADYLGQPMVETITLNGATSVVGLKAFYWIDSIAWAATAATTINVGWGTRFGLPYRTTNAVAEVLDGAATTLGTLNAPIYTDPQTATTGDPRGTFVPNTTPNAARVIKAFFLFDNTLNAAGNGGLYGIRHFVA
jgi:hypothetical protein